MTVGQGHEASDARLDPDMPKFLRPLEALMLRVNDAMLVLGMVALLVASCVLSYSVFSRYWLQASTDWQDEAAVFCLVGTTFLCGGFVQSVRGHVGIEAVASLLPAVANRLRQVLIDVLSILFCTFFAWKSWTLFREAWMEQYTTSSSWAPPLWIPYVLMAAGMSLLVLQLGLQLAAHICGLARLRHRAVPASTAGRARTTS